MCEVDTPASGIGMVDAMKQTMSVPKSTRPGATRSAPQSWRVQRGRHSRGLYARDDVSGRGTPANIVPEDNSSVDVTGLRREMGIVAVKLVISGDLIRTLLGTERVLGIRLSDVVGPRKRGGSKADVYALGTQDSLVVSTDFPWSTISGDSTRSARLPSSSGVRAAVLSSLSSRFILACTALPSAPPLISGSRSPLSPQLPLLHSCANLLPAAGCSLDPQIRPHCLPALCGLVVPSSTPPPVPLGIVPAPPTSLCRAIASVFLPACSAVTCSSSSFASSFFCNSFHSF